MTPHLIAPSVLAANFLKLYDEISMVNRSVADWIHIDIMDGHFVPNISFGPDIVSQIKSIASKPLDVHLMISDPDKYLMHFYNAGAALITVHLEACPHLHRTIQAIKEMGLKAGVAINPSTHVALLEDVLEEIDLVCVMSVNPGFGGQKFIYRTLPKVRQLKSMLDERNLNVHIEIDGGVGLHNAEELLKAGADVLVAGNTVFKNPDPIKIIADLKNIDVLKSF